MKFYLFSHKIFLHTFSLVHDYCTSVNYQFISTPPITQQKQIKGNNNRTNCELEANIVGKELYMNIKKYLIDYLEKICQVTFI
jgi:hypothetical protein